MANALEILVDTSDSSMIGPSLGAARQAMRHQELAYPPEQITDRFVPTGARRDYYQSKLNNYRQTYQAMQQIRARER